jgi:hypothetical protein
MRTIAYIDGFNLYYGCLKKTGYRWLDIKALVTSLVPSTHQMLKVKYFTARVSGASDPDAPRRQAIYLSALRTIPEVEIHYGSFLAKTIWRPIINLPVAGRNIATPGTATVLPAGNHPVDGARPQTLAVGSYPPAGTPRRKRTPTPLPDAVITDVHAMEEKGSDVNLAAHLLNDAWKDAFGAAIVISNETDLITPIQMVTQERKKVIFICCAGRWGASDKTCPCLNLCKTHQTIHVDALARPDPWHNDKKASQVVGGSGRRTRATPPPVPGQA